MGKFDIKYGNRNLTIDSMNVTTLKKTEMIGGIAKRQKIAKLT